MKKTELAIGLEVAVKTPLGIEKAEIAAFGTDGTVVVTIRYSGDLVTGPYSVPLTVRPNRIKMPWAEWQARLDGVRAEIEAARTIDVRAIEASLADRV